MPVDLPLTGESTRSTSAFGRAVLADALEPLDPIGARAARAETSWRSGYLPHFRRQVEAGVGAPERARESARAGLASVADRVVDTGPDGDVPLREALAGGTAGGPATPGTLTVEGTGAAAEVLAVPYRGRVLTGSDLAHRLDEWEEDGVLEPSATDALREVAAHPEWLSLPGRVVVALGVGSEIGPAPTLLSWGATVAGVDLPREQLWTRVLGQAAGSAGRLLAPVRAGEGPDAERAGLDLLADLPAVAAWLRTLPAPEQGLVLGNYVYADGGTNLRLSAATDALATAVQAERPDTVLAYMATPTDVFAVPADAVEHSVRAYESRGRVARGPGRLLRSVTAGRLLARNYLPGSDPGICDSLVPQQGPNYALGKRLHRWRATAERAEGRRVSMNVAPPTRTHSVVKNKALAAAYAGAHRFGVEVFEPDTTRALMAALLVHDLMTDVPAPAEPWREEARHAVHGGLWRAAYAPRSALGLAAVLGYGSLR